MWVIIVKIKWGNTYIQRTAHSKRWLNIIWYYHIPTWIYLTSPLCLTLSDKLAHPPAGDLSKWELYLPFPYCPRPSNHQVLAVPPHHSLSSQATSSILGPSHWCPSLECHKASHLISLPLVLPLANPFFTPCSQSDQSKMRIKLCNFPEGFAIALRLKSSVLNWIVKPIRVWTLLSSPESTPRLTFISFFLLSLACVLHVFLKFSPLPNHLVLAL